MKEVLDQTQEMLVEELFSKVAEHYPSYQISRKVSGNNFLATDYYMKLYFNDLYSELDVFGKEELVYRMRLILDPEMDKLWEKELEKLAKKYVEDCVKRDNDRIPQLTTSMFIYNMNVNLYLQMSKEDFTVMEEYAGA